LPARSFAPNTMLISWLRRSYAEHYEWALRFPVVHRIRSQEARLLRQVLADELAPGHSALEIGPGTGYYTLEIAPRVARLVAVEKSPEMAAVLRQRIARADLRNVTVVESDFLAYRPQECFDHVIALGVLDHIADWSGFLACCARLARQRVIFTMPHRGLWNSLYAPVAMLAGIPVYTHSADELGRRLDGRLLRAEDVGLRTRHTAGFTLVAVVDCREHPSP
jgi:SAM-dependent methyltransferase